VVGGFVKLLGLLIARVGGLVGLLVGPLVGGRV